jgi:hypothetical protein
MTSNDLQRAATFIRNNLTVDDTPGELDHLRFASALKRHAVRKRRNRLVGSTATIVLATIVGFAIPQSFKTEALTYRVGDSGQKGSVGSYVSAPSGHSLDIHFSEGSDVVLAPSSRGRVAQTTSSGATVVLEDGRARANIVHQRSTQWQILAGPYVVGVTGTSFDVAFNVATQTFELDMHSGSVRVTGPGLKNPIEIRDQQRLTLSNTSRLNYASAPTERAPVAEPEHKPIVVNGVVCPPNVTSAKPEQPNVTSAKPEQPNVTSAKPEQPNVTSAETEPSKARSTDDSASIAGHTTTTESFTQLGTKGNHARILELAERTGIDNVTANINAQDLMALGNAARFSGKSTVATKAYGAIRQRFGGSNEAAPAAFFLGRLAETTNPTVAMSWYDKYLTESPRGVWIADAMGRSLVLSNQLRGKEATLGAAKEYLERFPAGPYAGFARKLLSL